MRATPGPQGLYDPANEHDACGVAFVVDMHGRASRDIVDKGLLSLCHLDHRGASGAEVNTGDGAGILIQVPDRFLREVVDFDLPPVGSYATGIGFLPQDPEQADAAAEAVEKIMASEGLEVLGWREVPVDPSMLGTMAREVMPTFRQIFVAGADGELSGMALERRAFIARKRAEHEIAPFVEGSGLDQGVDGDPGPDDAPPTDGKAPSMDSVGEADAPRAEGGVGGRAVYFPSLSCRTLNYKGMLTTGQLDELYADLRDPRVESAIALVHSRFSTNTFPAWPLAHPYRYIAHNGEINTVKGNRNWMRAREALLASDLFAGPEGSSGLERAYPICDPEQSDSGSFDEVLELLHLAGRPLHHAVLMMIPEAWENNAEMDPQRRA
ncbi:MAG TPA: hypothetical protein VFU19_01420, partial [Iamia sp.]|nr:hypothetical protein [Iamia sp.]